DSAVGTVDMQPDASLLTHASNLRERVHGASTNRPCSRDHDEWHATVCHVSRNGALERRDIHPQPIVCLDPANGSRAEPGKIGGFLNPGMRFLGCVCEGLWGGSGDRGPANVPS